MQTAQRMEDVTQTTIYVVDDEQLIADLVETILRSEGFNVRTFNDPIAALQALKDGDPKPSLLVTDFVMKPLNGLELMAQCRRAQPDILTLLYSGNVSEQITDLYPQKPDAFLEKPFNPQTLVDVVRGLLAQRNR